MRPQVNQVPLHVSCMEGAIAGIVAQAKALLLRSDANPVLPTELFLGDTDDAQCEYWNLGMYMIQPNFIVAMACMALQDLGSTSVHFCDHGQDERVEYNGESDHDQSWMVYSDDHPVVIYWEDERNWNLPTPGEGCYYSMTIFHKGDRDMDRIADTGIKEDGTGWGPKKKTWVDKAYPVRYLVDRYIGYNKRDLISHSTHDLFLARRFAIAQIEGLPGDVLCRISDMDHICNVVGRSLRKRGYERYYHACDMWPSDSSGSSSPIAGEHSDGE
jgi:hypothetical protein